MPSNLLALLATSFYIRLSAKFLDGLRNALTHDSNFVFLQFEMNRLGEMVKIIYTRRLFFNKKFVVLKIECMF